MIFRLRTRRFDLLAVNRVSFPAGSAANTLRGTLGKLLWGSPAFSAHFAPRLSTGPSGLADPPRPFVLRAAHLNGAVFEPGQSFHFDVNIFDSRAALEETFARALSEPAATGIRLLHDPAPPVWQSLDLNPASPATAVTIAFRTPTDLKGKLTPGEIPFAVLFARVRDRIATLSTLYGDGPLAIDFKGMATRAAAVRNVSSELFYCHVNRQSKSSGNTHPLGGFTGLADYEGDLTEFIPWLHAAWWTGVGRHTVWGNGVIECLPPTSNTIGG